MPRSLIGALDRVMLQQRRRPAYKIEIFDLRSTISDPSPTVINDIVEYNVDQYSIVLPDIVGPRDFTNDVESITIEEAAGDFVDNGIAASSITFKLIDNLDLYDPLTNPPTAGNPEAAGRWLRQGNVVRVKEGDAAVDEDYWPITFTGRIRGQPGRNRNRTTRRNEITVKCVDRAAGFLRRESTSQDFSQYTTYQTMVETIATSDMGLRVTELDFPTGYGTSLTQHLTTQFHLDPPLVDIANILFIEGQMPRFDGLGRLTLTDGIITKGASRVYSDDGPIITIERPVVMMDGINKVIILGLDADMMRVDQERQVLATASLTTGFFAQDEKIHVRWSDDGRQQAFDTAMRVLSSVGGLAGVGSESYTENTQVDGLCLSGDIDIRSGFHPAIIALIFIVYVAAAWIPNFSLPLGGPTINSGQYAQSMILAAFLFVIQTMGRGNYEIVGIPCEFVFPEIRCVAQLAGLLPEDVNEVEIQNQLVNDTATGDAIALRVLRREVAKQNERSVEMIHDLRLIPDDKFTTADGRSYMIASISRTLHRARGGGRAQYACYEVTEGVRP